MTPEQRVRSLPIWKELKEVTPLKGGVSNASFTVTDASGRYVARVGEDYPCHQVSREREAIASRAAFEALSRWASSHNVDGSVSFAGCFWS